MNCRLCKSSLLEPVLDLGEQALASIVLKSVTEKPSKAPLLLVKCQGECGLLQLSHTVSRETIYGEEYGYRSGINDTMTHHLKSIVDKAFKIAKPEKYDLIVDIGSNDGTLLNFYGKEFRRIVGFDPSGKKFENNYNKNIVLINDYFIPGPYSKDAKIITSIAMLYDLEDPLAFVQSIKDTLDDEGIWIFEQSYMPFMVKRTAYDTVCHEHLEYYGLKQIKWMLDKAGLRIIDIELNDINAGSICVVACKENADYQNRPFVEELIGIEEEISLDDFRHNVRVSRLKLLELFSSLKGKIILGYGASTKGNVILQYCGLDSSQIPFIADRNPEKWGKFTPGTLIPIISEEEMRKINPDYLLALPYHFRAEFLFREFEYSKSGGKFIFPLPKLEII